MEFDDLPSEIKKKIKNQLATLFIKFLLLLGMVN